MKNISDKIIDTANILSKQADYYVSLSEHKVDIKHLDKEIKKRQLLIGKYIYEWFIKKSGDITAVPKLCKEIEQREAEKKKIQGRMKKLRKNINSE